MKVVGEDEQLAWCLTATHAETTNVQVVSLSVVLESSAVKVLKDIRIIKKTLEKEFSITINNLDDDLVLIIDKDSNVVGNPFAETELLNSIVREFLLHDWDTISINFSEVGGLGEREFDLLEIEHTRGVLAVQISLQDASRGETGSWGDGGQHRGCEDQE
jgi:hypothetical protein